MVADARAKYRAAIHVPNAQTDDVGMVVFGWDNPQPDKVIRDIELKSLNGDGIVVVAAITASDKPVRLPDPKDIPQPEYLQSDLPTLDPSQWFPVEVVEDKFLPTPIDQSGSLDAPAGKHGFMKTVDGRWAFEDGAPVRLVATMQGTPQNKKESAVHGPLAGQVRLQPGADRAPGDRPGAGLRRGLEPAGQRASQRGGDGPA